ncbi:MAG TPA: ATP-dependent RecD-like DNA helicase [Polyangia bacterium]|jgi:exodeoxyribonuclease V alpha subunit
MDLFDRMRPSNGPDGGAGREETVQGTVDRIVFAGSDGTFTVARLAVDGTSEPLTVVGGLLGVPVGARLRVTGRRESTPRFGPQFRITGFTEIAPATLEGMRKYLGSGLIKGIGPEYATRIVEKFGIETLELLDRDPGRISEVPGIGPTRARAIREAWSAQREVRKVMVFLQGYGVSPAFAARIYKRYGLAAIALLRENPYRLAFDVWGIGFLSADKLAVALGIAPEAPARIEAGVRHVLEEASTRGDVFVARERLVREAASLLGADEPLAQEAIDRLARAGEVVVEARPEAGPLEGGEAVYTVALHRAEVALAAGLKALLSDDVESGVAGIGKAITGGGAGKGIALDADRAIAWYEAEAKISLARQQIEAVTRALGARVLVVTGGPGVGKTTIVRGIVSILSRKGCKVALAAPTGRAAKRLSEATGQTATTLHRLLEWRPAEGVFGRAPSRPIDADLLVVDEASMLDVRLAADLVAALAPGSRLVLVGDVDQLPSVGPGTVLGDLIASDVVPTVRLTEIFRQAGQSLIVRNAHRIHDGEMPELGTRPAEGVAPAEALRRDFFFMEEEDPAKAAALIRDLVVTRLPRAYGLQPHDIQVLSPMHRGELGAGNLNALLQEALTAAAPGVTRGNRVFRVGDKVMQVRNNYDKDVFNGDIGRVVRADAGGSTDGGTDGDAAMVVAFDDREVPYVTDELDELQLAYAATVHKAQGSEYPAVVVPVHTQHFVMLQRNLLYTAVTRARQLVVLVGTRKALGIAVRNADVALRGSRLDVRLRALASP